MFLIENSNNKKIMNIIAQLIKQPCNFVSKFPFTVTSYQKVINTWKKFKNGDYLPFNIHQIFSFHLIKKNHVILYNSKGLTNALLLCFINEKYINILLPNYTLDESCIAIWLA